PLVASALLETVHGECVPALSPFHAPWRVCRHLAGDDELDDGVAAAGGIVAVPDPAIAAPEDERACSAPAPAPADGTAALIVVDGADGVGRRPLIARAARATGRDAVAVDLARLAGVPAMSATLAALRRECLLRNALPIVAGVDDLVDGAPETAARRA